MSVNYNNSTTATGTPMESSAASRLSGIPFKQKKPTVHFAPHAHAYAYAHAHGSAPPHPPYHGYGSPSAPPPPPTPPTPPSVPPTPAIRPIIIGHPGLIGFGPQPGFVVASGNGIPMIHHAGFGIGRPIGLVAPPFGPMGFRPIGAVQHQAGPFGFTVY